MIFHRFVNVITGSQFGSLYVWEHVKKVRAEFNRRNSLMECDGYFLSQELIELNFELLSKRLKVTNVTNDHEVQDIPIENINDFGLMFVFLNSCPLKEATFYRHLILERSTTDIVLLLANLLRKSVRQRDKLIANKILRKVAVLVGFQLNKPSEDFRWSKNIRNIQGKLLNMKL